MARAREMNLSSVHRSSLLASVFHECERRVAVTGSFGKTTITAMIGWALAEAGLSPTVVNGGVGGYNVALLATAGAARTLVADVTTRAGGGGVNNYGILLSGSGTGVTLQGVTALGENASNYNFGLFIWDGAAAMARALGMPATPAAT